MSLITISGSQGQGKTTVLSSLAELGYNVIPHKTSRLILDDWGYTLNEVNKDLNLKKKFQDEILVRHVENNRIALESDEVFLSERSFADIFTYSIFTLGAFNEYSEWLDGYYQKCKQGQAMYDAVISLSGRTTDIDNDGVRSVNQHFTESIDIVLQFYLEQFTGPDLVRVSTPDHAERVTEICNYIDSI
jgi:thymidylate kinase